MLREPERIVEPTFCDIQGWHVQIRACVIHKVAQGSYTVWPLEGRAAEIVLATTHHIRQPALFGDLWRRAHARKRLETKQQSEDDGVVFHRV